MIFWEPENCRSKFREKCHFRGTEGELAGGQEKPPWGVSSEMTELNFIPSSACARRRVSERNRRKAAALGAEMTAELLAGGLFEKPLERCGNRVKGMQRDGGPGTGPRH